MDRLARALTELRAAGPFLLAAAGEMFVASATSQAGPVDSLRVVQASAKADALVDVLRLLAVDVIAPGPSDLARAAVQVRALAKGTRTSVLAFAPPIAGLDGPHARLVKQVGPYRVGLLAEGAPSRARVTQLGERGADLVLMFRRAPEQIAASGSVERARASGLDVIIETGGARTGVALEQGAIVLAPGKHAEALSVVRLRPDPTSRASWRLVPELAPDQRRAAEVRVRTLDAQVRPDPTIRKLLDQLFARIDARHAALSPKARAAPAGQPGYVGARTCAACHTGAYFWWARTRHAAAHESLRARGRALDLDCIGCHVTGFAEPGGAALGRLEELKGVGCESCHGPGSLHADNPQVRQGAVRRQVSEVVCAACHDAQHSDDFAYGPGRAALLVPGHGIATR